MHQPLLADGTRHSRSFSDPLSSVVRCFRGVGANAIHSSASFIALGGFPGTSLTVSPCGEDYLFVHRFSAFTRPRP